MYSETSHSEQLSNCALAVKPNSWSGGEAEKSCSIVSRWLTCFFLQGVFGLENKRLNEWTPDCSGDKGNVQLLIHGRSFYLSLANTPRTTTQSPLSVKCPGLCMEQSCMVMSSVWITLGSQTHVRSRLHLPLPFASTPYPLMTSWRSARLYIMSDTEDLSAVL